MNRALWVGQTAPTGEIWDRVEGRAKTRELGVCLSGSETGHFTAVLPANVQTAYAVYQLGYMHEAGRDDHRFVMAIFTASAIPITSPTPILGHTYKYVISQDPDSGNVRFRIYDMGPDPNELIYNYLSNYTWPSTTGTFAWYGYETQDGGASDHGHAAAGSHIDMRYMGASVDNNSSINYLSGLVENGDVFHTAGWNNDNHHGHVGEWNPDPSVSFFDGETH